MTNKYPSSELDLCPLKQVFFLKFFLRWGLSKLHRFGLEYLSVAQAALNI